MSGTNISDFGQHAAPITAGPAAPFFQHRQGLFVAAFAACFPVDWLADVSNAGTLFAFLVVAIGVMILRKTDPDRPRSFKTPLIWVVGPLAIAGCLLLFVSLGMLTVKLFFAWAAIGLVVYFTYARSRSNMATGVVDEPASSSTP